MRCRARNVVFLALFANAAVLACLAASATAHAQIDTDFPRPDGPQRPRPPEPTKDVPPDTRGDAPADTPRVALGAGSHFAFATAPQVALGFQASAELATIRWSLGLEGRYDLPTSGATVHDARARTWLAGVSFVPCARAQALWACAVVLASRVSADGAADDGVSAGRNWFSLGVGGRVAVHFGLPYEFALRLYGDLLFHPIPQSLHAADGATLYTESVISMSFGLGMVHAF